MNDQNVGIQPVRAINENQIISTAGSDIPEQTSQPYTQMPRQVSFTNLIYQWQPMGFRVILNLPFIGDDSNFLFAIRNGPFIPTRPVDGHYDIPPSSDLAGFPGLVYSFAYNNMVPVILPSDNGNAYPDPSKPTITLTNYDLPPPIATFAQCFRRWRGDMQYRLRMVAGFATQGYVVGTSLKNTFSPIGIYNQYKNRPALERQDISFRPAMLNSYALSDTSMFRHLELTMEYDYPTPYYDQFEWISRRCVPGYLFEQTAATPPVTRQRRLLLQTEPHGDNWIVIGLRGNLESSMVGSQIVFELEYRCAEGFQFADPFFPPRLTSMSQNTIPPDYRVYRVPDNLWTSDGIGKPTKVTTQPPVVSVGKRSVNIGNSQGGISIGQGVTNIEMNGRTPIPGDQAMIVDVVARGNGKRKGKGRRVRREDGAEITVSDSEEEWNEQSDQSLSMFERLKLESSKLGTSSRNN